jgi:hypothetical protein
MGGEVNGMRALLVGSAALLLVVVGCGTFTPVASGGYKLYTATSSGTMQLAVIDSQSKGVERKLQIGAPSRDWTHLYSVISNSLIDTNPETGNPMRTLQLPRSYELPKATISGVPGGLSQNGRWLVLEAVERASLPTMTHLLLVETSFSSALVPIELKGWFEFDAISNDGRNLYLIQYVGPQQYHVRLYHVAMHQLDPNFVVEKGAPPNSTMAGIKMMSVPSPDGQWLYTLYAREHEGAFIHGLNLNGDPFAACIDLPGEGFSKDPNQFRWSLAISPDGLSLYAANGAMGVVTTTRIGPNTFPALGPTWRIGSQQPAPPGVKESGSNTSVVSPDGKTLIIAGGTGLIWIDTTRMEKRATALDSWRVWSVGLTPDGQKLYALNDAGNIAEVSMASASVGSRFDPAAGHPVALMRVAAA